MGDLSGTGLIVPTLNAGATWSKWIAALECQNLRPERILVVDSGSSDGTVSRARAAGLEVKRIDKGNFDHGGTRQLAVEWLPQVEYLIFLTQDAVLASPNALGALLEKFRDPQIGAAYGRQLPRPGAGPIEAHGRLYNYPKESHVRSADDRVQHGIKACFLSNSFSAYRAKALHSAGGFPRRSIVAEDMYVVAKMLMQGWKVAYQADACVYHSHDYSIVQEFRRYFDTGVFHAMNPWIRAYFGGAESEGVQFLWSELRYLLGHRPYLVPSALARNIAKAGGYRLGRINRRFPVAVRRRLSMHQAYWSRPSS